MIKSSTYWVIILLFLHINFFKLQSQFYIAPFTEIGNNNASFGNYVKLGAACEYKFKGYSINAAYQANIAGAEAKLFSGINVNLAKEFNLKYLKLGFEPFFKFSPFNDLVYNQNLGMLFKLNSKHLLFQSGFSFQKLRYFTEAIEKFNILPENQTWSYDWNSVYKLGYTYISKNEKLNVGFFVSNFDYFIVNQLTNPIFNFDINYKFNPEISVYLQPIYKFAGASNGHVNYFGFSTRLGCIWLLK